MMRNKIFLFLFALLIIDLSCQSHKHSLNSAYKNSNNKALASWIKSWKKQTQSKLSDNYSDTIKNIQACYSAFFHPENPNVYLSTSVFHSTNKSNNKRAVPAYWIIQENLPYAVLADIKLPDTTHLNKGSILDHYHSFTKKDKPDTLTKGEFLSKKNTPVNWLLLDAAHQNEISQFFGSAVYDDSIAKIKSAFLKPYFNTFCVDDRPTPLHKRETWVAASQPEIMLMVFDSSMTTAQIFFMIGDLEIGFAILSNQNNNWKLIYTKLDYWDRSD